MAFINPACGMLYLLLAEEEGCIKDWDALFFNPSMCIKNAKLPTPLLLLRRDRSCGPLSLCLRYCTLSPNTSSKAAAAEESFSIGAKSIIDTRSAGLTRINRN
jgi:hypothetical protein